MINTFRNQKKNPKELAIKPGKVNGICVVFRQALESIDTELYIQTILTTFAKQTPPDLESAMIKIKEIKSKIIHNSISNISYIRYTIN